jgi:hypothetical protein
MQAPARAIGLPCLTELVVNAIITAGEPLYEPYAGLFPALCPAGALHENMNKGRDRQDDAGDSRWG